MSSRDLVDFLRARLAEDERVAQAATGERWRVQAGAVVLDTDERFPHEVAAGGYEEGGPDTRETAVHIARHDPARVLAEVAAKRAIVDRCAEVIAEFDRRDVAGSWPDFGPKQLAETVLAAMGAPYADHPDYREEFHP